MCVYSKKIIDYICIICLRVISICEDQAKDKRNELLSMPSQINLLTIELYEIYQFEMITENVFYKLFVLNYTFPLKQYMINLEPLDERAESECS